jgi:dUTP pyrophosphatase
MECHKEGWINAECPICGKQFHLKPSKLAIDKNHYCSRECHHAAQRIYMKGSGNHQYGLKCEKNPKWKGGRKFTNYGYYTVYCPDHPFADKRTHHVFEHRLIAEKYLLTEENSVEINGKRYLRPEYAVHHIDFDRTNNDVSNLAVMTKAEHKRLHNRLNSTDRDEKTGRYQSRKQQVLFKKVVDTAKIPTKATPDSAGYDMYAEVQEPIEIPPGEGKMISSGVAMSIPKGYAGFIFARSGLSTKRGLRPTTCVSVIDADYRGVVGIPLFNDSKEKHIISPHDRISQIIFIKTLKPKIEIVDKFDDNTERGDKGFGSTGR